MTITAVFESLEEMQEFAGKLNGGSIQGAVQEFIKGEDIYRTSETRQKPCMQDEISEDRETPAVAAAAADAASPKLWQKAAPTKSPRNVTAESEEP